MGMTYVNPDTAWMQLLKPIIKKKRDLAVDSWAYDDAHLREGLFGPLHKWFQDNVPAKYAAKYPWQWRMNMHVFRGIRGIIIPKWADYFLRKSFHELDELTASWKIENCSGRERLNEMLKLYAPMKPDDVRLEGRVIQSEVLEEIPGNTNNHGGVFELAPSEKMRVDSKVVEVLAVQ
jgi:endoglucanase